MERSRARGALRFTGSSAGACTRAARSADPGADDDGGERCAKASWSPSRDSKPALPLTGRLHRLNASGARDARRDASRKIDKRTALPLRIPKKRGRLHEAPSNSGRSRCQTAKVSRCRARARIRAAPMHGSSGRSTRAHTRMRAHAVGSSRVVSVRCIYGPIGSLLPGGGGWWPAAG